MTPSAVRWATATTEFDLGPARVTVHERDRTQPFLLLHGGAGPTTMTAFGDLLASRRHARVITPTHPGFAGTPAPAPLGGVAGVAGLARLYADLLQRLDVWDVTVVGNSVGGWIAAELALLGSPRVSGVILIDAVGIEVPEHPVTDVSGLTAGELAALTFHEPERFPTDPAGTGSNLAALAAYTGMSMTDPTLAIRLRELDLPVCVVWGASDGIVSPDYGRAYAEAVPGARFTLLPDTGHLPQVETPEELLGVIADLDDPQPGAAV